MIEERHEPRREKETGRIEAFSDGVFAVAITLLVFGLQAPTLDNPLTSEHLVRMLLQRWPSYLAFFISFATILIMWISHHAMFKLIDKSDTPFLFANGFLLLLVTTVPFPTQLIAMYLTTPVAGVACAIYAGLFLMTNLVYNLLWWLAAHQSHLLKDSVSPMLIRTRSRNYALGAPCYLLALILAFWSPGVSIGICSVLWLFWAFTTYERIPAR
ncbi:DUF1211 domain-containing membrane protein [Reticulibacter mediterranei]|uniref:DUF1211 domain-containing membrane protein n=1 Tax=Reticulibacter mediterranei TaxID=2778369 RepID=A0A8J3IJ79_9CHLR|nr:TMEM175 family protein [Reticulibacter mediterranei]GHO94668.1 DUF1211 domain-containing membrane protein [Reticulibacter mediterranei]